MNAASRRLAPPLLLLIVCGGHLLAQRSGGRAAPVSPWAAAELLVPGLFAHDGAAAAWPFDAASTATDHSLVWTALAPAVPAAPHAFNVRATTLSSPYVGWIPLWLALAGLLPARSLQRRLPAPARLLLLALALAAGVVLRQSFLIVAALSLSAAVGLSGIRPAAEDADVRPQLVAAGCCVLLTAALIAASLRAGFATDAQALQPLVSRLDAAARSGWDPASTALEAAHLRAVLDRAALAAFAGMTALLLHLKSRAPWSAALLLVVTAADVCSVAL